MHQVDIRQIDLNLLIILKVLLDEQNVTRASEKLNLSQSATSHALKRLRQMFNDPLLERSVAGMRPTARALTLRDSLEQILGDIEELVKEPIFTPELAKGTIRIATSDYATTVILPTILRELAQKAPYIDVECYDWQADTLEKIRHNEIDLGLGIIDSSKTNGIKTQNLFVERFVSIVRRDHPILEERMSLQSYIRYPHALITTGSPTHSIKDAPKGLVDRILEEAGLTRRVMLKLPHFFSGALIISNTDLILTLPRRIALLYANNIHITLFDPPIALGEYHYMQIWASHTNCEPLQGWLRNLVSHLAASM
ncbi:MAG: LysR family transcriptional regulator [Pseudanabaena sp. ELA607]|jgi:DNA-binding transcriptional LysR family regulator